MNTQYIIRNGGFQKKQAMHEKPDAVCGEIVCLRPTGSITKGRTYKVLGHFCYLNTYGSTGEKFTMWDQFVIIKNDDGYTVKVNLNKFYVVPKTAIEIMYQTI